MREIRWVRTDAGPLPWPPRSRLFDRARLGLGPWLHGDARDADLLHPGDLERPVGRLHPIADPRDAAQPVHDQPRDRVDRVIFQVPPEQFVELVEAEVAPDEEAAVLRFLHGRLAGFVRVLDLSGYFLDDVLERDQSGGAD